MIRASKYPGPLFWLGLFPAFLSSAAGGAMAAKPAKALEEAAKALLLQGHRKEALGKLAEAQALAANEKERTALLSKKRMFAEQFLLAESFEKYQAARGTEQAEGWAECLSELDGVDARDQDNLKVLVEKARCNARLKRFEVAEKLYGQAVALLPESPQGNAALLGLVETLLARKEAAKANQALSDVKADGAKDVERIALARAGILEAQGKNLEALEVLRKDYESSLDHFDALLELGRMHFRRSEEGSIENAWQARKYLSLFAKRCASPPAADSELKARQSGCKGAEEILGRLDKRLNQQPLK